LGAGVVGVVGVGAVVAVVVETKKLVQDITQAVVVDPLMQAAAQRRQ
jgi:hypothetical protein